MDDMTNPPAPAASGVNQTQSDADLVESALFGGASDSQPTEQAHEQQDDETPELAADGATDADNEDAADTETDADTPTDDSDDEPSLAAYLGLDESQIATGENGEILINAKIDGQIEQMPLAEVLKGTQLNKVNTQKAQALAEERKQFEEQAQQVQQHYQAQLQQAQNMAGMFEKELLGEYNRIDWELLRRTDPGEFAARQSEFQQKAQNVQQAQAQISQELQQQQQQAQQHQQQLEQQYMADQAAKMIENNPEWADETVRKTETTAMRGFLSDTYGFNDQDIALVTDHRVVKLIQDAQKYRNMKAAGAPKLEKKVPKFQKPNGASRSAKSGAAKAAKNQRAKLKQSGSMNDLAAVLKDRM